MTALHAAAELTHVVLEVSGETLHLHGSRALFWPARQRLYIADLHLGKADIFRRAGIAVPRGGTGDDLARLASLIASTQAQSLWVLGDFLHGSVHDAPWREAWQRWRTQHAHIEVGVLSGNHDRALPAADSATLALGLMVDDGPFRFQHMPDLAPGRHVVCGHVHPAVRVPGMTQRWPAFWLHDSRLLLPAFSAFTGRAPQSAAAGERVVACIEGSALLLPASREWGQTRRGR